MTTTTTSTAATGTPVSRTVFAPRYAIAYLGAAVAKSNKIAEKLGVEPFVLTGTSLADETFSEDHGEWGNWVTITGEVPVLPGGWTVLAVVKHLEAGNLITAVTSWSDTDEEVEEAEARVEAWRIADPSCDHCGLARKRKTTLVVEDETGAVKRVGLSCSADFLGHADPAKVLWFIESTLAEIDDFDRHSGGKATYDAPVIDVLRLAVTATRVKGFVPKSAGFGYPTSEVVAARLWTPRPTKFNADLLDEAAALRATSDDDLAVAEKILAWLAGLPAETGGYLGNLRAVALGEEINVRYFGLLCSAPNAYKREVEKIEREAKVAEDDPSVHFGSVKERLTVTVTVERTFRSEGHYGTSYLIAGRTPDGNVVSTWSSGKAGYEMFAAGVGSEWVIKGTVKEHGEFREVAETVLSRVVTVERLDEDEVAA